MKVFDINHTCPICGKKFNTDGCKHSFKQAEMKFHKDIIRDLIRNKKS
jgi:hypothetical protein